MRYTGARMIARLQTIWSSRGRGATAVEYALLVALIAIAVISAVTFLGQAMGDSFNNTANSLGSS
jgi:pilus assembly protein Flp/PilA